MSPASALPTVVVTGAAGLLGKRLVQRLCETHRVVGLDWRARGQVASTHPNVRWVSLDIADREAVRACFAEIRREGGAEFLLHLAAYYDFSGEEHPEYARTNVGGTRTLLEEAPALGLRRFVYASSVAACDFNDSGPPVSEETPPHGRHPYARSKAAAEALLFEHAARVPSCAVRFAAIFSDWCEYPPLHEFLSTWLSSRWNHRMLGGRGRSSVPYLHARDAVRFLLRLLEQEHRLERFEVLLASPDGAVSHRVLYETAVRCFFEVPPPPLFIPPWLCAPGIRIRDLVGRLQGRRPFERPWMVGVIDRRLEADASRTRARLGWTPQPRLDILRRIPFMIENMRSDPLEWQRRNTEATHHVTVRPNLHVARLLERHEPAILEAYQRAVGQGGEGLLERYRALPPDEDAWHNVLALGALMQDIRTGEKSGFMGFCRDLAGRRRAQGFRAEELAAALHTLERACREVIGRDPEAAVLERAIRDHLSVTVEFGVDQVFDAYDDAEVRAPGPSPSRR